MPRIVPTAVLVGLVAGILVGIYHNIFTVPVIEQAIALEEAAAAHPPGMPVVEEPPLVSLGVQRIGMVVGTAVFGVILGLVFAGGYALLRRSAPQWSPLLLALAVGALGFWSLSLLPFFKYPFNPPGVGNPDTLLFRQGFQFLFLGLSALGAAGVVLAASKVNRLVAALAVYAALVAVMLLLFPSNPDPVSTPPDLLLKFRTLSVIGHLLQWALLAVGVALVLKWAKPAPTESGPGPAGAAPGRHAPNQARR
ncbi:MAG TPA: CbtA family protein [Dehalococcoidia bacterium]|nr:CbtA family protein [Dehalococcoidia bacterium]